MSDYCSNLNKFTVVTDTMKKICKYHKRRGQEFTKKSIANNFCYDAFHTAYPYCLALLYNSNFKRSNHFAMKNTIYISCPNPAGITMQIRRKRYYSLPVHIFKKIVEFIFRHFLSFPLAIEDWNIEITVMKNKGECPANYKNNVKYHFNIKNIEEMCPASFHAIYPYLLMLSCGNKLPWNDSKNHQIHCPDHEGMIYSMKF